MIYYHKKTSESEDKHMITDRKAALREIKKANPKYKEIASEFWADKKFVLNAVSSKSDAYRYASEDLKLDKEVALQAVQKQSKDWRCHLNYDELPMELRSDSTFIKEAINIDPLMIGYASDSIKDNYDIAMQALRGNGWCYGSLSDRLQVDKEIVLVALSTNPNIYSVLPEELRADKDIVLCVAPNCALRNLVKDIPSKVCEDKEILIGMAKKGVRGVECLIPEKFLSDSNVIIEFMKNGMNPYQFFNRVSEEVKNDKDFAKQAVRINASVYNYLSDKLRMNEDIALEAIKCDPHMINNIPFVLSETERDLAMAIVEYDGKLLEAPSMRGFLNDYEVVLTAVLENGQVYNSIPEHLQQDETIMLASMSGSSYVNVYQTFPEKFEDKEFMLKAISLNSDVLFYAPAALKMDREFMLAVQPHIASRGPCEGLGYFREDKDFILEAVKSNPEIIKYIPEELRYNREFIQKAINNNPRVKIYCDREAGKPSKDYFMNMRNPQKGKSLQETLADARKQAREHNSRLKVSEQNRNENERE